MMLVLISGPKQPGNDMDVYLKPLIEDLLLLWKEDGVCMWDAHTEEYFNLCALLFVTPQRLASTKQPLRTFQ